MSVLTRTMFDEPKICPFPYTFLLWSAVFYSFIFYFALIFRNDPMWLTPKSECMQFDLQKALQQIITIIGSEKAK